MKSLPEILALIAALSECCGIGNGDGLGNVNNCGIGNAFPEPEAYAMLLSGLGPLGFAARLRKLKAA